MNKLFLFVVMSYLVACGTNIDDNEVEKLVNNDELYKQLKVECEELGTRDKQMQYPKCQNFHKAADKRALAKPYEFKCNSSDLI